MPTLGEVVDWRTQLRANDIARRPSAKGPDRGYVDQSPPQPPSRPPTVIPLTRLEEAKRVSEQEFVCNDAESIPMRPTVRRRVVPVEDMIRAELERPKPEPLPTPAELATLAMTPPEVPPEPAEAPMPAKKTGRGPSKRPRRAFMPEFKLRCVDDALAIGRGGIEKTARAHDITPSVVAAWVTNWKTENPGKARPNLPNGAAPSRTIMSGSDEHLRGHRSERDRALALLGETSERTIETVSRELQAALTQVKILKAELKSLLD